MGNNWSTETNKEKERGDFIETSDGVKISSSLLNKLMIEGLQSKLPSKVPDQNRFRNEKIRNMKAEDAIKFAEDCQAILDAREKQLLLLRDKWRKEIENERAKHKHFYDLSVEEFEKAAKDAENKFSKPCLKPVCASLQRLLVECYKSNPGKLLHCTQHVENFQKCVDDTKQAYLRHSEVRYRN